ncbi:AAEL005652-PA [Aedes aegypti]|uniref:AAEL005652-PA n=1 Tax=Aedes aegypti TaxID=7159 RepID=Q179E5_AEDAE|nr:AAEL005652-PA [Aedes aegypti]
MNPITCALRFVHLREYEDDLIQSRSEDYLSIDGTKAHMTFNYGELNHVILWKLIYYLVQA